MHTATFDPTEALARIRLFRDFPPGIVRDLAATARRRTYRRGGVIVRQGEAGDSLFVIQSGKVEVFLKDKTGVRIVLETIGPGGMFGELSLLDAGPRSATVAAIDDVAVVELRRLDFMSFIHAHAEAMDRLLVTIVGRLRRTDDLAADLMRLDTRGRLAKTLLDLAREHGRAEDLGTEIELPITQGDLAAMVGATRERVNRVLGGLEEEGAIQRRGRHIIVRDRELLRQRIA